MTANAYEGGADDRMLEAPAAEPAASTLADVLRERAAGDGQRIAYTFLADGERDELTLTYAALDEQARRVAAVLGRRGEGSTRAVLLYPPGLDFVAALFGCFYAGVVAVPVYPPDPRDVESGLERVQRLAVDADASLVLTTDALWAGIQPWANRVPRLRQLEWCATDALGAELDPVWRRTIVLPGEVALLQYTSGSTGDPQGVMVTHANLVAQGRAVAAGLGMGARSVVVGWLPLYHDMGLVGTVLIPMQLGCRSVLLSPMAFLERPLRWLQALSRYGGTQSPAPNFAYDLCVRKIAPDARRGLDLAAWTSALNGAEPVRADTCERFAAAFAPCGFRREAFVPCYGLAEATLMVSGGPSGASPTVQTVERAALDRHRVVEAQPGAPDLKTVVGCGAVVGGHEVVAVHPDTRRRCHPDEVGELWVAGPSVAAGYWGRADETAATFGARLADGRGPFLRTGDLGFVRDGVIFVTGRRKDLIVIRGRNHYPQDLERSAERAHAALRPGCGAAFVVTEGGEERLAVVYEIDPGAAERSEDVARAIRAAVAREHQVHAHVVALIPPRTLPKTSSGKVRRRETRRALEAGTLATVGIWRGLAADGTGAAAAGSDSADELARWLVEQIAELRDVPAADIHLDDVFLELGIDSAETAELLAALEERVGRSVPMRLFLEYPTIGALARALDESAA